MPRGGITRKQLKRLKAEAREHKPIHFNGLKLILMNTINPQTKKYYTEKEATNISGFAYKRKLAKNSN